MTAQEQIIAKYGEPSQKYFSTYCTLWQIGTEFPWFPTKKIYINIDFMQCLKIALKKIEESGLQDEIETFDGCYVERKVRGSNKISLHSWALAWDINAHKERLAQTTTHFSPQFLAIMKESGIYWGGDFKGRKDPMHFGLFPG